VRCPGRDIAAFACVVSSCCLAWAFHAVLVEAGPGNAKVPVL
jgi:hypothetical protein